MLLKRERDIQGNKQTDKIINRADFQFSDNKKKSRNLFKNVIRLLKLDLLTNETSKPILSY